MVPAPTENVAVPKSAEAPRALACVYPVTTRLPAPIVDMRLAHKGKGKEQDSLPAFDYLLTEKRPNPARASTTEAVKRLTPVMMQLPPPVHMGGWANMRVNCYRVKRKKERSGLEGRTDVSLQAGSKLGVGARNGVQR